MDKDLLTIPEFAEAAGIKKQGIYQQIKNDNSKIAPFVVFQGEKAFIKREALKEVYGIKNNDSQDDGQESQVNSQESKGESQGSSQDSKATSQDDGQESQVNSQESKGESQGASQSKEGPETEQSIIVFLQRQLEEKDRQIAQKDKQIERIQQLLDQEQRLHLSTKLLLEDYRKQDNEEQEENGAAPIEKENQEPQEQAQKPEKKRSWLYNLFFN